MTRWAAVALGMGCPLVLGMTTTVGYLTLRNYEPPGRILAVYQGCHLHCAPVEDARFRNCDITPFESEIQDMAMNRMSLPMTLGLHARVDIFQPLTPQDARIRKLWPSWGHVGSALAKRQQWTIPPDQTLMVYRLSSGRLVKREPRWSQKILNPMLEEVFEIQDWKIDLVGYLRSYQELGRLYEVGKKEHHYLREFPETTAVGAERQARFYSAYREAYRDHKPGDPPPMIWPEGVPPRFRR